MVSLHLNLLHPFGHSTQHTASTNITPSARPYTHCSCFEPRPDCENTAQHAQARHLTSHLRGLLCRQKIWIWPHN